MRFSEKWLREWVNPPVSTDELVEQLTMAGLEVDGVEPAAPDFSGVVVGEVVSLEPHPDADKLRVCQVSTGEAEPLQIVCGAANVYQGMKAPLATIGAVLPGNFKIKKAKLRGVQSFGMLCSEKELGMADSAEGLWDLPADAPVGMELREYLDLDDRCIEIDLTPNRGDCLSLAGVAREVGVLNRCAVTVPEVEPVPAAIDDTIPVEVLAGEDCPRYLGRVVRGVNPQAPTPLWMRERLRRSGLRSISVLVDITNYVMLELGQPMHAFDLDKLDGGIRVRRAAAGEELTVLDGTGVKLEEDMLVIADHARPQAVAGIIGGLDSGVTGESRDILLESAFFSPLAIAGRARRLGLSTDSSHRFERGVDPRLQRRAMERATALVLEIAGGQAGPVIEVAADEHLPRPQPITLRSSRISRLLGIGFAPAEVTDTMQRLGLEVEEGDGQWRVTPPSFRFDLAIEADLIEELGRIHGYGRLPSKAAVGRLSMAPRSEHRLGIRRIRELLVDRDYQEAISYSFVDPELQQRLDPEEEAIALANPLSSEMSVMRTSLWPGLVRALQHNLNRQQHRVRMFESGLVFVRQGDEIKQINKLAAVVAGSQAPEQWGVEERPVDFYDVKGDVEALLELGGDAAAYAFRPDKHPALHPGQTARIERDGRPVGWLGAMHPRTQRALGLDSRVFLFEMELEALEQARLPAFEPLSRFPAIRRDLAIVVDEGVSADELRDCVSGAAGELLQELIVFDIYRGQNIEIGRKSFALGLILQDSSRTLNDKDVDDVLKNVVSRLEQDLGANLRD
jgi:phenylalanyl-tRNA synthetase beta chain